MKKIPEFKYADAARCPFEFLAECRQQTPVVKLNSDIPAETGFMVTRFKDVAAVCRDPLTYSSTSNPQAGGWGVPDPEAAAIYRDNGWPLKQVLVWVDPPEHKRFRGFVDKIFSPSRIAARAGHIAHCIDKLITRFGDGGEIDAVADFAALLPAMVMTREFSAPEDDYQLLIDTTNSVIRTIQFPNNYGISDKQIAVDSARAATRFQQYMMPRIEAVRANPNN